MITVSNFTKTITSDILKKAPEVLRKDYEFVKENIDLYDADNTIKKYIDTYISKLNHVAGKSKAKSVKKVKPANSVDKKKPVEKKQAAKKPAVKKKAVKSAPKAKTVTKRNPVKADFVEVPEVSPEVRFIKRYVLMDGKTKTRKQLLSFINALQRAIEKKQIRKTSRYAAEIRHIQNELIKIHNNPDLGDSFHFSLDNSDKKVLEKYQKIAGSQKQRTSVRLISRYVGIHGKVAVKEKAGRLLKAIRNALDKKQIEPADPYIKEVKTVKANLEQYLKAKEQKLQINTMDLKGLQGIAGIQNIKKKSPEL